MKLLWTIQELADASGVSYKRMRKLLVAYGIEPMTANVGGRVVAIAQLREKMQPLYDSLELREKHQKIVANLSQIRQ